MTSDKWSNNAISWEDIINPHADKGTEFLGRWIWKMIKYDLKILDLESHPFGQGMSDYYKSMTNDYVSSHGTLAKLLERIWQL